MRVVFTIHSYYPFTDGVSNVMGYLAKGLVQRGNEVTVITHFKENLSVNEIIDGIKVLRVYDGDKKKYIDTVLNEVTPESVLINVCLQTPTTDFVLPYLDKIECKKKILYMHGIWKFGWSKENWLSVHNFLSKIYNNSKWYAYYFLYGKYIKKYDVVTQLHEFDDGNIFFRRHYGINSVIIENAADPEFFNRVDDREFRERYSVPDEYLVCVAKYSPLKNQEMVLRAYYRSKASIDLIFVGGDSDGYINYLKDVEKSIRKSDESKKVTYVHDIPREDIAPFVRNARLFLFGSVGEKFPVSVIESMAAGVPYISTDVGIVRYLPGGVTVGINDNDAMAEKIDLLIENKKLWEKLSAEGHEYAMRRMSTEAKISQLEAIIKD